LNEKKSKWVVVLLAFVFAALIVNAVIMLRFVRSKASKPCLAIPTRFILEYPECAEKLVRAANVSNVRIVLPGALEGGAAGE
jgi:hypothetical protein